MADCEKCGFGPLLMVVGSDPAHPQCGDEAACAARQAGLVALSPGLLRSALEHIPAELRDTAVDAVREALKRAEQRRAAAKARVTKWLKGKRLSPRTRAAVADVLELAKRCGVELTLDQALKTVRRRH